MATGVARPKAHGQEMTRTEMAVEKANSAVAPRRKYQMSPVMTAMVMTTGTKMPEIVSANFAIGALLALASSTSLII